MLLLIICFQGDSGGAILDASGRLASVVSFGSREGCESAAPNCYADVHHFQLWINSQM